MSAEPTSPESTGAAASNTSPGMHASAMRSGLVTVVLCTCVASGLFWFLLRHTYPIFEVPRELSTPVMFPSPEFVAAHRAASSRVDRQHAALFLGLYGALVSAVLGVGEAVHRRSIRTALVGALVGGLIGALGGVVGGLVAQVTHETLKSWPSIAPATRAVVVRVLLFGITGGGIGLAYGVLAATARAAVACAAHGALGGALAGILFPLLVVAALPPGPMDVIVPHRFDQSLLWVGLTSVLVGLMLAIAARKPTTGTPWPPPDEVRS